MEYRIEFLKERTLVGVKVEMSYANNKNAELVNQFVSKIKAINHRLGNHKFSLQNYRDFNIQTFTPTTTFEKWFAVEVSQVENLPETTEVFTIPSGRYLVIPYQGTAAHFPKVWQDIFTQWLPKSEYQLDNRPHFEILPEDYRPDNPKAKEDIYIPIK